MPRPSNLSKPQQKKLRALAHELSPLVTIGKDGISEGVLLATREALDDHELIKVKVLEGSAMNRKLVGPNLAEQLDVHHIATIGRIVVLYSRHPTEPRIPI